MKALEKLFDIDYRRKLKEEADAKKYAGEFAELVIKICKTYGCCLNDGYFIDWDTYDREFEYVGFRGTVHIKYPKTKEEFNICKEEALKTRNFDFNIPIEKMFIEFSKHGKIDVDQEGKREAIKLKIDEYNYFGICRKDGEYWCYKGSGWSGSSCSGGCDYNKYAVQSALNVLRSINPTPAK